MIKLRSGFYMKFSYRVYMKIFLQITEELYSLQFTLLTNLVYHLLKSGSLSLSGNEKHNTS